MRIEKTSILDEVRATIGGAEFIFLVNYTGLTVKALTELRALLETKAVRLQVMKNTFIRLALPEELAAGLAEALNGPTAVVCGRGDASEVAKLVKGFIGTHASVSVKGGCLNTQVLTGADVMALAALPSREIMLGRLVGTVAAPMTQLVGVMGAKVRSLLYVLKAVEEKKNQAAA
jgi:large subunit ribosomal protein L10